jgi:ammonia channel protein AmtB
VRTGSGKQLAVQIIFILAVYAWVGGAGFLLFKTLIHTIGLRHEHDEEEVEKSVHDSMAFLKGVTPESDGVEMKMAAEARV